MLKKKEFDKFNIIINKNHLALVRPDEKIIRKNDMSLDKIRKSIKEHGYKKIYINKDKYMSDRVENLDLPYMNFIFYLLIFINKDIPSYQKFKDTYIELYLDRSNEDKNLCKIKKTLYTHEEWFDVRHVEGRVFRSYYSFLREVDLLMQLLELGYDASYVFQKDIRGVDISVKVGGKNYEIASYLKTERSLDWKNVKNTRRHNYGDNAVDLIACPNKYDKDYNCSYLSGVILYNQDFIKGFFKGLEGGNANVFKN